MKPHLLFGLSGAIVLGATQALFMKYIPDTVILRYGTVLLYFMLIYMTVLRTRTSNPDQTITMKDGLKAGGITSLLISLGWGIGYGIGLTHQDIKGYVNQMIATGHGKDVPEFLRYFSDKQTYFDAGKGWAISMFILGFVMTLLCAWIQSRKKSIAQN